MNRAGYTVDFDDVEGQWQLIRWRGQVASAIRGKRGQAFLRDLVKALDDLPEKRLIAGALRETEVKVDSSGFGQTQYQVCAIGALGPQRGIKLEEIDPEDYDAVAAAFDITHQLVREIEYMNDEMHYVSSYDRWYRVRNWAASLLRETAP